VSVKIPYVKGISGVTGTADCSTSACKYEFEIAYGVANILHRI
jgi:hypothetical protein